MTHTHLDVAADWIVGTRPEDLPPEVFALARSQVVDTVAAICAGARSDLGARIRRGVERGASGGPCTVLPDGARWSVTDAVYLHSALANALELDNFVLSGHFGQSAVAVGLALGEMLQASWSEILTAQVVGLEVATRLGAYISAGPHHGHMRAYGHRVAAAACAARLLGLDAPRAERALAVALAAPEYPLFPASFSPDTKANMCSAPSVEGLRSAFLAEAGLDATTDILVHPLGLVEMFTYMDRLPDVWARLGRTWFLHSLSSKAQATCAYAQGPVTCAVHLQESGETHTDDIESVVVDAPLTTVVMESFSEPHRGAGVTLVNTQFSTRRSVAAGLLFGRLEGDFFDDRFAARSEAIEALTRRVELRHDWGMTVDLLRGIDAGIEDPGKPGLYGMGQAGHTLKRFRDLVGSRPLLSWRDVPRVLGLRGADRSYLVRRFWRGYRARLPFLGGREARLRYASRESDMSRLTMRMSGRVNVRLRDGRTRVEECRIPPGFAGDPDRELRMREKFRREAGAVLGAKADAVLAALESIPSGSVAQAFAPLRGNEEWDERDGEAPRG